MHNEAFRGNRDRVNIKLEAGQQIVLWSEMNGGLRKGSLHGKMRELLGDIGEVPQDSEKGKRYVEALAKKSGLVAVEVEQDVFNLQHHR